MNHSFILPKCLLEFADSPWVLQHQLPDAVQIKVIPVLGQKSYRTWYWKKPNLYKYPTSYGPHAGCWNQLKSLYNFLPSYTTALQVINLVVHDVAHDHVWPVLALPPRYSSVPGRFLSYLVSPWDPDASSALPGLWTVSTKNIFRQLQAQSSLKVSHVHIRGYKCMIWSRSQAHGSREDCQICQIRYGNRGSEVCWCIFAF